MYQAFNKHIIVKRETEEQKNEFGIITDASPSNKFLVVATNDISKELQDKVIVTNAATPLDHSYLAVDTDNIIAVCK